MSLNQFKAPQIGTKTMTDRKNALRERIAAWLAEHPDSTTDEIAAGIGADMWDVQHTVCFMVNDNIVQQVGKRELEGGRMRPVYRIAAAAEEKINGSQ